MESKDYNGTDFMNNIIKMSDILNKLKALSELEVELYGKDNWFYQTNQKNYREALSQYNNEEEEEDVGWIGDLEVPERCVLLNSVFFEQFDLINRARKTESLPRDVEYMESDKLVDELVKAQTEEVRRCRILAEKERELFPDEHGEFCCCENREALKREEEILRNDKIMMSIEKEWLSELDEDFEDEWYADRYQEYVRYCHSCPIDEYPLFFNGLDFHGKCLSWEFDVPNDYFTLDDKELMEGDISIPFEEHNIWDAVLLYFSTHWLRLGPKISMVVPMVEDKMVYPRVIVRGDMALAMFCATDRQSENSCQGHETFVDKYAVLLNKKDDSLRIVGGYKCHLGRICVARYYEMPPDHLLTHRADEQKLTPEEIKHRMMYLKDCNEDIPF